MSNYEERFCVDSLVNNRFNCYNKYKYFKCEDFDCSHTGLNKIQPELVEKLDELRESCGFPFIITSGYRDPSHPEEIKKKKAGTHSQGIAADIKVANGAQRYAIVKHAIALGFNGIGVANSFIHVDLRKCNANAPSVMWKY
jgi:uncharacterized protein YcbK (DUF882 family)